MPRKQHTISDEERAKRLRETAREIGANATRDEFERTFKKIVTPKRHSLSDKPSHGRDGKKS